MLVTLPPNMSPGRMEDFTEIKFLDTGPIYFFDQIKPKRKIWEKRKCEDHFPLLECTEGANYNPTRSIFKELEKAKLSTVAESGEKDEFISFGVSQTSSVSMLSTNLKFSKLQLQKSLFEEYKLTAAEILYELEEVLQKYAVYNITFPVGIVNLVDYSWHDLTSDAYKYATKNPMLKKCSALKDDTSIMTMIDLKGYKINSCSREECHKRNCLVKVKEDHHDAASKPVVKTSLVDQQQCSQISQDSSLPVVTHFSLTSKICLENGWVLQPPSSKLEILKWKTILDTAVKKLQVAIMQIQVISMMFNQDGGMMLSKKGTTVREWIWPSKGKLDDPVEIWVNKFITVKISGRFAITLIYKWHPQSISLSLAPVKCKPFPPQLPEAPRHLKTAYNLSQSLHDVNTMSEEARKLFKAYKVKCKQMKCITQNKDPSSLTDSVDIATFDPVMDISPMSDVVAIIKLRGLQTKAKHILLQWLDHYRFALGIETRHICKMPKFPQKVVRRRISTAKFPLKQSTKESNENKEYLRYQNTFLKLKGMFKPLPLRQIQKTPASSPPVRLPLPIENKDAWFASQLVCPVVLRWALCGNGRNKCYCSTCRIPEVTDLEYDHLIFDQLSSVDQIIIVYVFSAKKKDRTMREMAKLYTKLNRHRSMPCVQCHSDAFRLMKYNVITASKFTSSKSPLLVQRHNVIPGIFLGQQTLGKIAARWSSEGHGGSSVFPQEQGRMILFSLSFKGKCEMYIRGKLLFANFIFNGYGTSAKDLQKQTVKTRSDYHMGYFLPNDFRIRAQPTSCFENEDTFL
ncbi:uncharacterized protein [Bos taurus]|uniref:uncharacterized protein isoform X2 n=1 Tax=Bos taurus TaxID=9913 RepID=UPI0028CB77F5|nr:uncharacterized protein LOC112446660 isoform X2 [Bos taurus]